MSICRVIKKKDLDRAKRFDAEYFDPKFKKNSEIIENKKLPNLSSSKVTSLITDGDHGNPQYSGNNEGAYYIKSKDLTSFGIDFDTAEKVTAEYKEKVGERCALNSGDVLLSTVGTIGVPCIALTETPDSVLSRDIAKIVPNEENISSEYLYMFLGSEFCQSQIDREVSGSVQGGLYLHALNKIAVNLPSNDFQKAIQVIFEEMVELNKRSQELHKTGLKAIDICIEKDEESAMKFLADFMKKQD